MMIPIPKGGVFHSAEGVKMPRAFAASMDVIITAKAGQRLIPLPEGSSYLGFIFARGATAAAVETALRTAHSRLRFQIATALDTFPVERTTRQT